jgi:hypothetical protein
VTGGRAPSAGVALGLPRTPPAPPGELALSCSSSRARGAAVDGGGDTDMAHRRGTPRTAGGPPAQRRSVRMDRHKRLVPVDLPVDAVVVLEQEERAGQIQRAERSLG